MGHIHTPIQASPAVPPSLWAPPPPPPCPPTCCAAQSDGETAPRKLALRYSPNCNTTNYCIFLFYHYRDEGAKAIAEMIQDPGNKLVTIKLSDNRVGAAGAAALAKATTRWVDVPRPLQFVLATIPPCVPGNFYSSWHRLSGGAPELQHGLIWPRRGANCSRVFDPRSRTSRNLARGEKRWGKRDSGNGNPRVGGYLGSNPSILPPLPNSSHGACRHGTHYWERFPVPKRE